MSDEMHRIGPQMNGIADLLEFSVLCRQCTNRAKYAFYAVSAASWTTGLLAGLLIAALAWSHLGG